MKLKDTFMSCPICVKILKDQCISIKFPLLCRQFFPFITLKQTIFSANYSLRTVFLRKIKNNGLSPIFSQFLHIAEIGQTPQFQDPLSRAFHKYLQLVICVLVDLGWVYKLTISKRSEKQWLRFKEEGDNPPPSPDMLAGMA